MVRIKGWKKVKPIGLTERMWVVTNTKQPYGASVEIRRTKHDDYLLILPHTDSLFKTKKTALKWAVKYMRRHPNG